jgi:hypothetical protein
MNEIKTLENNLIGKRITMIEMVDEYNPIENGMKGIITHVGFDVISVRWDNGRHLGVIIGEDQYTISESTD